MASWTAADIPDQTGKTAVVTGANSGIGLPTALELARKGAKVTLACRDLAKGTAAIESIRRAVPDADVSLGSLDLADLASVRAFAEQTRAEMPRLDLLINNAGVMALPSRQTTRDGHEMQFGTNVLGHFALTALLAPALAAATAPRVVTVASLAHNRGKMAFDDLNAEKSYTPWSAYSQSKLGNLMFALELQRRATSAGSHIWSLAAHPGYSATNLQSHSSSFMNAMMAIGNRVFAQSAEMGALPTLYAATSPAAEPGGYYGPGGFQELRGHPEQAMISMRARDEAAAARLWQEAERLTGVAFPASSLKAAVAATPQG